MRNASSVQREKGKKRKDISRPDKVILVVANNNMATSGLPIYVHAASESYSSPWNDWTGRRAENVVVY